jgi:hypothetical protein
MIERQIGKIMDLRRLWAISRDHTDARRPAGPRASGRRIWLCADDYGISPAAGPRSGGARSDQRHLGDDGRAETHLTNVLPGSGAHNSSNVAAATG